MNWSIKLFILANILVEDPTVFEIVQELKNIQNETERFLKKGRNDAEAEHQREVEEYTNTLSENELAHTVALVKIQHEQRMKEIDKKILKSLDEVVLEQQQTLVALNIPGFYETTDSKAQTTQMHLFAFLLRLQKLLENQT